VYKHQLVVAFFLPLACATETSGAGNILRTNSVARQEQEEVRTEELPGTDGTLSSEAVAISVIVPARNEADVLPDCLAALNEQTVPRATYEVILVDDGSSDSTPAIGEEWGARVIRQKRQGPAAARNRGAQAARGDLLLFTDADCVPAPDWIAQMIGPFSDPHVVGVKGTYQTRQRSLVARFVQIEYEDKYERMEMFREIDFIDTYAAAYRREVFLQHGGFDTQFSTASVEDQELSFRLAESGHRLVFNPRAVVYHRHPDTLRRYWRRKYGVGYWKVRVLARHPSKALSDTHTPQSLKVQMGWAMGAPVLALLAGRGRRGQWVWALFTAGYGLLIAPFVRKAWRKDRAVGLIAPLLLFVRAWALGLGLLVGLLEKAISGKRAAGDSGTRV